MDRLEDLLVPFINHVSECCEIGIVFRLCLGKMKLFSGINIFQKYNVTYYDQSRDEVCKLFGVTI